MVSSAVASFHSSALLLCALSACSTRVPERVRQANIQETTIRFDLSDGLRSVPWPNDALCWSNDVQTGPCLPNLPTTAQTPVVAGWIDAINRTRGWPTIGPIVIPFERTPDAQAGPVINLARLKALQEDSDWSNDALYLMDLENGLPHTLDFPTARGSFVLHQPLALDPSDPRRSEISLLIETIDERYDAESGRFDARRTSNGDLSGSSRYNPEWDADSDGNVDVPVLLPGHPCSPPLVEGDESGDLRLLRDRCLADGLVDAYDAATDTLRIYPRTPLRQGHEYAVVITDRLFDNNDRSIRAPLFSGSQPRQRAALQRVLGWLGTSQLTAYYGDTTDPAANHVRFVWSFTTGSPRDELRAMARRLQPDVFGDGSHGQSQYTVATLEREYKVANACPTGSLPEALANLLQVDANLSPSEQAAVVDSYRSIASLVTGVFAHATYSTFDATGISQASESSTIDTQVPFWITLPKSVPPDTSVPLVIVSPEQSSDRFGGLLWAGQWATLGLATLGFDRGGSVSKLAANERGSFGQKFDAACSGPLLEDLLRERGDSNQSQGRRPSDVDPNVIVTRDRWRSDAIELATLARSLEPSLMHNALENRPLALSPAAIVGVGTGASVAALASALLEGAPTFVLVDPATSPDRAWSRGVTWGADTAELWRVFGPRLAGVPVATLGGVSSNCATSDASIRLVSRDTWPDGAEVGCLALRDVNGAKFAGRGSVIATNVATLARRCVTMTPSGEFSLGIAAADGDALVLSFYDTPDVVAKLGRDGDCEPIASAPEPVFTLGVGAIDEPNTTLSTSAGGLGLERQSSELLQALDLAAAAFALAHPAPFIADLAQPSRPTDIGGLLLAVSPGDPIVPTDEGLALARAAQLIPRFPPENLERFPELAEQTTPTDLAGAIGKRTAALRIEWAHLDESVPRLKRFPPVASACGINVTTDPNLASLCQPSCRDSACPSGMQCRLDTKECQWMPPNEDDCAQSLPDLDALAGDLASSGSVQPIPYLRLARYAGQLRRDTIAELWRPQSRHLGPLVAPTHPDWPFVALALPLANPLGGHGIARDDLCQRFRFGNYLSYLIGQFIDSRGTSYPPIVNRDTQQCLGSPTPTLTCPFLASDP